MSGKALWVPLDVNFLWDEKVLACDHPAQVLFIRSLCLSKQTLSDGFIGRYQVASLCFDMEQVEGDPVAQLVDSGLWVEEGSGYQIAAWFKHNPTADQVQKLQESRREAGRKGGQARAASTSQASASSESKQRREQKRTEETEKRTPPANAGGDDSARLALLLAELIQRRDPEAKVNPDGWVMDIDRLIRLDKRTPADVERVIRWCQQDTFWQSNILSGKKLREKFTALYAKAHATSNGRGNTADSFTAAANAFLGAP